MDEVKLKKTPVFSPQTEKIFSALENSFLVVQVLPMHTPDTPVHIRSEGKGYATREAAEEKATQLGKDLPDKHFGVVEILLLVTTNQELVVATKKDKTVAESVKPLPMRDWSKLGPSETNYVLFGKVE